MPQANDLPTVMSGPPAIDWALDNPTRVTALVLLNTYYAWMPRLRRLQAIFLYSTPVLRNLARAIIRRSDRLDRWLFNWQISRFIADDDTRHTLVPQLYEAFRQSRPAFWRLNEDLLPTVISRRNEINRMKAFPRPGYSGSWGGPVRGEDNGFAQVEQCPCVCDPIEPRPPAMSVVRIAPHLATRIPPEPARRVLPFIVGRPKAGDLVTAQGVTREQRRLRSTQHRLSQATKYEADACAGRIPALAGLVGCGARTSWRGRSAQR